MRITTRRFDGERPRRDIALLGMEEAQLARNCKLWAGNIRPFKAGLFHATPSKQGNILSIYRFGPVAGDINSGDWFNWTSDVDVVRSPVRGDVDERTYFTGDGPPKMTYKPIANNGSDFPSNSYLLGIPEPAATTNVTMNGTIGDAADKETRVYAITYVSDKGEEGPPAFTSTVDWYPGNTIDLTGIPTAPSGNYNITNKRIYRTATAAQGTDYYFVAQVPVADVSYNDAIPDTSLGEALQSTTWEAPPSDMHSIRALPNGMLYGCSKNEVYVSQPYQGHAWNPLVAYGANYPFVTAGHFGNTIVAITERNPHLITGVTPDSMDGFELQINHGCVSKRSLVMGRFGVGWASPDGFVVVNNNQAEVVSENFYTEDEWAALNPASMLATVYNNRIFIFYDNGTEKAAVLFDPRTPDSGLVTLDVHATAVYSDPLSDTLFLVVDNKIVRWDEGTELRYKWKSRRWVAPRPVSFSAGRILAEDYADIRFRLYADGQLIHTEVVTSRKPFRMPHKYLAREFELEVEGTSTVRQIDVAESVSELAV